MTVVEAIEKQYTMPTVGELRAAAQLIHVVSMALFAEKESSGVVYTEHDWLLQSALSSGRHALYAVANRDRETS